MSFGKKILGAFVQEVPQNDYDISTSSEISDYTESEYLLNAVNTDEVREDHLLEDLYQANGKDDLSKSIFKVEELMKTLPKEMPSSTKRTTVLAIMGSFRLDRETAISDGNERLQILTSAKSQIIAERSTAIDENQSVIEQKKREIEELEIENARHTETINTSSSVIDSEIGMIKQLITFIGGEN